MILFYNPAHQMHQMIDEIDACPALQSYVDAGALAGIVAGIWQHGELLQRSSVGVRALAVRDAMQPDAIFRIASMSKPITSTLALMFLQDGRFTLDEPITRWAPEFSQMRVLSSASGSLERTEPAHRHITFDDLLTHRAGFTYGPFHSGPLAGAYEVLGGDIDSQLEPNEWISRLASLPLVRQPGAALHYGHSTDLLGLLLQRIGDAPLADLFQRRIFGPLNLADTGFTVPSANSHRKAGLVGFDAAGKLMPLATCPGGSTVAERPESMTFVSGGQGLWSTLADYGRFARLFAENGAVDGVQLLQPNTLKLMTTNRLTPEQRTCSDVGGLPLFANGYGFGLGLAVVMEPTQCLPTLCNGGVGTVSWPGGFGGWWQADPTNGKVMVFLCHNMVEREQFARGIGMSVYEAIARFHALGSRPRPSPKH
jgi:CubicO group peptidase (beta-lactamase class C family)